MLLLPQVLLLVLDEPQAAVRGCLTSLLLLMTPQRALQRWCWH